MTEVQDRDLIDAALGALQRRSGWVFPQGRAGEVSRVIHKIWRVVGQLPVGAFATLLESDSTVFDRLIDELAVGESYFFREPAHFDLIRSQILPEFLMRGSDRSFSVWSAGCASGEEAYSLAILFEQEAMAHRAIITGTDLSPAALRNAEQARYRPWSLRSNDTAFVERYFEKEGEYACLCDRIRKRVRYERHNLNSDALPPFAEKLDLILCRNVMIYFDTETIARLARLLFGALGEDGWLLTAPADPLLTPYAPFIATKTPAGIVYRRQAPDALSPIAAEDFRFTEERVKPRNVPAPASIPEWQPLRSAAFEAEFPSALRDSVGDGLDHAPPPAVVSDVQALALRIRTLANLGDLSAASREVDGALERYPLLPELHYLRALISLGQGKDGSAVAALRRTIYLDRNLAVAHFALGAVRRRKGDTALARRAFENVAAICDAAAPEQPLPQGEGETAAVLANAARRELARLQGDGGR